MKLLSAVFEIEAYRKVYRVVFYSGKIVVNDTPAGLIPLAKFDNSEKRWKPCETHAKELVKLAAGRTPASNQAKRRVKDTKPDLRLLRDLETLIGPSD